MKEEGKFKNRYRIPSNRLSGWDYSNEGIYFLTICAYSRECLFGEVVNHEMVLNEYGSIVQREWVYSAQLRSEIQLGSFVVMPNHMHAIVHIVANDGNDTIYDDNVVNDGNGNANGNARAHAHVETHGRASLQHHYQQQYHHHHQPLLYRSPKSISSLIAGFKSSVTKQINRVRNTPGIKVWQANYYDHIIRDDNEYQRIADYIEMNPARWNSDELRSW